MNVSPTVRDKLYVFTVNGTDLEQSASNLIDAPSIVTFNSTTLPVYVSYINGLFVVDLQSMFSEKLDCAGIRLGIGLTGINQSSTMFQPDVAYYFDKDTFVTMYSVLPPTVVVSPFSSLNGNNCEFLDGALVSVYGRSDNYIVDSSFYVLVNDNQYTVMYRLMNNGSYTFVPESLLTLVTLP